MKTVSKKSLGCCQLCGKSKDPKTFYRAGKKSTRLRNICISCRAKQRLLPEKTKKRREWLYSIPARFRNAKKESEAINRLWTISETEYKFLAVQPCHYCKKTFFTMGSGLDRIDNTKGYELSNVLPCCKYCNGLRSNKLTVEEMEFCTDALIKFRLEKTIQQAIMLGLVR